jgi:hypothetical protein
LSRGYSAESYLPGVVKAFPLELLIKTLFDSPAMVEMAEIIVEHQAENSRDTTRF